MNKIEQIWNTYHSKLHRFIKRRVHDASLADDILQDIFVRIQSRIGALREDSKLQGWLYQITRNAMIDHYRDLKKTIVLPENLVSPETDPGDKTRQEIAGCILPLIESLPDHYREVLMLSEIEGLSHKEVATKKGLSLPGVKSRVQRGRAMVKKLLMDCCRFEFDHQGNVTNYESKRETCDPC
jgi:RNA polymerase sigma-70 factor (ECF subfamily)